jgi:Cu/Ag efflux pump CusA
VLAVNFLSLGWRPGIVVALCIPLVLAMTFVSMLYLGIDLQRISLARSSLRWACWSTMRSSWSRRL